MTKLKQVYDFPKVKAKYQSQNGSLASISRIMSHSRIMWHGLSFYVCYYIYILDIPYAAIMFIYFLELLSMVTKIHNASLNFFDYPISSIAFFIFILAHNNHDIILFQFIH